jgi:hypothetical protein
VPFSRRSLRASCPLSFEVTSKMETAPKERSSREARRNNSVQACLCPHYTIVIDIFGCAGSGKFLTGILLYIVSSRVVREINMPKALPFSALHFR